MNTGSTMAKLCRLLLLLAATAVGAAYAIVGVQYPYILLLVIGTSAWQRAKAWRGTGSAFGTARLASVFDLVKARMIGHDEGWILGSARYTEPPTRWQVLRCLISPAVGSALACRMFIATVFGRSDAGLIRVPNGVHALTCASTGSGKTTSVLGPNLLSFRGSCVVVDPKGELYELSKSTRQNVFGHRIVKLDPFNISRTGNSDALNPFDFINETGMDFLEECRCLADMLVEQTGKETDPHWNARAIDILTAFSAFVCALESDPSKRNLTVVRDLVSSEVGFREAIRVMKKIPAFHGVLRLMGDKLTWLKGREQGSVLSTVSRHIGWLDSPAISDCISRSTFDPRWLWSGKVTCYIMLPHDKLTVLAPLMRMWMGTILRQVSRNGASEKYPVQFFIDEAAQLGRLQPLEEAICLLRSSGVRIWLFLQSLEQLHKVYGESAPIMLGNLGTQQYFGINMLDTADHLSKRIGDRTQLLESINRSVSRSRSTGNPRGESGGNITSSESITISEQGRRLIRPEEVLVLPDDVALVFHQNLPPITARLVRYFEAPEFSKGGTGLGRRLGPGALFLSVVTLLGSLLFLAMAACIPSPEVVRRGLSSPASPRIQRAYQQFRAGQPPRMAPARPGVPAPPLEFDESINGRCIYCLAPMRLGNLRYENVRCRACGEIMGVSRARIKRPLPVPPPYAPPLNLIR
jgi:type IV secretion system protein VirD4